MALGSRLREIYLIIILNVCLFSSAAGNPVPPAGVGAVAENKFRSEGVYFPRKDLDLYVLSGTEKYVKSGYLIGYSEYDQEDFDQVKKGQLCVKNTSKGSKKISEADFAELSYEGKYLIYYEIRNGFIKILKRTDSANPGKDPYDQKNGFYLKISDLNQTEFKPRGWMEILQDQTLLFNAVKEGLNLRKGPNAETEKIMKMTGENFTIVPSGKTKGQWMSVKVQKRKGNFCEDDSGAILKEYQGWIKAVDDSGKPNVWFFSRGC